MNRNLTILAGSLVGLIAIYAILSIDPHRIEEKPKFLANDTSQVDYVKITHKGETVVIKRVGGHWRLAEPYETPANPSYMKTLLEKAASLELETEITSNQDAWEKYELTDSLASYIEIGKSGGRIDKFWCGKPSETYTHTYMRLEGKPEVLLVSGTPRSSFQRRPKDWRDKTVLALDRTLINRVVLKHPDATYDIDRKISSPRDDSTLVKADTTWLVTPPKGVSYAPEINVMNRILNTVAKLNSIDILDAGKDTVPSFAASEFAVEVYLEGNVRRSVEFVRKPDDDTRFVGRLDGGDDYYYVIYQSSVKNLMKRDDELQGGEKYVNPQDPSQKELPTQRSARVPRATGT
ncbi:MAG: DUF4340 domain-containing protein [Calditrichaeota bacterium]|nr:DUF4340 domain-containing protein [Calditrichota bacterium]